jgi:type I restriction enzyme S subunit
MSSWGTKKLGELVAEVKTGSTPPTSRPEFFNGSILWFTPADIGASRELTSASRHISLEAITAGKTKLFPKNSLLVTCIGQIGRIGIIRKEAASNQQITSLTFNGEIDIDYAYYWFLANRMRLEEQANQAVVPILNNERLLEIELSYPKQISEQKSIAARLATADYLHHARQYSLEVNAAFLPAVFMNMFGDPKTNPKGWDMCLIEDIVEFSQYGTSKKSNSDKRGYPILGMANVTNSGRIDLSALRHVELEKGEFDDLRLQNGDIIFNRTNSTELVGKTTFWNLDMGAVLASYLVRLRLKPEVIPAFFSALLNTGYFKNLFRDRCKKAVGQSNISPTLLKEFPVYIPPLLLQRKFAALVERMERLRAVQREALRQAEHLFQSLLHDAFQIETATSYVQSKSHHV